MPLGKKKQERKEIPEGASKYLICEISHNLGKTYGKT